MSQELVTIPSSQEDELLVTMWLKKDNSEHTRRAHFHDIALFYKFTGKGIRAVDLNDIQTFAETLKEHETSTQARIMMSVKSLLTFGYTLGYLQVNVGKMFHPPKPKDKLAERILTEAQVLRMITLETNPRNHALLRLLYMAGLRVEELCSLTWRDLQERDNAGQVNIYGKGNKTRTVLVKRETWLLVQSLRHSASLDDAVFQSRKSTNGRHNLDASQVHRIVRNAAKRAGIEGNVSPHWLRHSHATHAIERGATLALVKQTLGHERLETVGRYLHARPNESSSQKLPLD